LDKNEYVLYKGKEQISLPKKQFEILAAGKKGVIVNQKVKGYKLPSSVLNKLKKAPRGTMVIISSVKTIGDDGEKRASGVTLKIK